MKNIIVAWCNSSENDFENFVPLNFVGERNLKLGFSNDMHVLFLNGINNLTVAYKKKLSDLGYHLHDCSHIYQKFDEKYNKLSRFGDYEKKCFLRWLVIDEYFRGEQIIHYDGDIVFNEDVAVIQKLLNGFTFVLQGCPAFTCISDLSWFESYKSELDKFIDDIQGYSAKAWQERTGWEVTFRTRWSGSRFREIITSDQDFLSHLMHTGRIVQDSVEKILLVLNDYIVFQNPLYIHMYDDNFPYLKCIRENGIDYFLCKREDGKICHYKKRVLFWHMQSGFNFYLAKFIFRKKFLWWLPIGRLPLLGYEHCINKKFKRFLKFYLRLNVYDYFLNKYDFSGIMRDKVWWKRGIFD